MTKSRNTELSLKFTSFIASLALMLCGLITWGFLHMCATRFDDVTGVHVAIWIVSLVIGAAAMAWLAVRSEEKDEVSDRKNYEIAAKCQRQREQRLIDLTFEFVLALHMRADYISKPREELTAWVTEKLRESGFDTQPCGASWGVLKPCQHKRTHTEGSLGEFCSDCLRPV